MRTIAIANQKGGCGKTTTAVNVAAALALSGHPTLLVDLDPQGHGTLGLGHDPGVLGKTMHEVITDGRTSVTDVLLHTRIDRLALAPSNILLGTAELDLCQRTGREMILGEKLKEVADGYDYAILDCPPQLGLLMLNALMASDYIVITVQVQYFALEGLKRLLETIHMMQQRFPLCRIQTLGLVLTFVEDRVTLSRMVQQQLRNYFGPLVCDGVIHKSTRLAEAPNAGESILTYAPHSKAASEYQTLTGELIARIENAESPA
jgi:chromosome partitioning protein